jgi:hypothetical protein
MLSLVAVLVTVTVAAEMTALLGSVMVPTIRPDWTWAQAEKTGE